MNKFTSAFRKPDGTFFFYPMGGHSLSEEQRLCKRVANSEAFGEYRYSRRLAQTAIQLGELYKFKPNRDRLQYQSLREDLQAPFDYFQFQGSHKDECVLVADAPAVVAELGLRTTTRLSLVLKGVQSFKFQDLCKEMVFGVSLTSGEPRLVGFHHAYADLASVSIPLTLLNPEEETQ